MSTPPLKSAELKRRGKERHGEVRLKSYRPESSQNQQCPPENNNTEMYTDFEAHIEVPSPLQSQDQSAMYITDFQTLQNDARAPCNDVLLHDYTDVTLIDACVGILKFSRKFNLTDDATDGVLKLMRAYMPEGHKLPQTIEAVEKIVDTRIPESLSPITYEYCPECPENVCVCQNPTAYFVKNDSQSQLKRLVRDFFVEIRTYPEYVQSLPNGYTDIQNGSAYQENLKKVPTGCVPLAFNLFVDGGAYTNSTNQQTWPICLMLTNLSPMNRTKAKNVVLAGFWHGGKPDWDYISKQLDEYFNKQLVIDGAQYYTFCTILTADMPARASYTNTMSHGATRACPFCHVEGCKAHKGPMQYGPPAEAKTLESFDRSAILADLKNLHRKKIEDVEGSKGVSLTHKHVRNPTDISIDLLHTGYIGTAKDDTERLTTGVHEEECSFSKTTTFQMARISDSIINTQWPSEVPRKLRPFADLKRYKASEWSVLITVLNPTVVAAVMMETHLAQAQSITLYSAFMHLMAAEHITEEMIQCAEKIINIWFDKRPDTWGKTSRTLKSHEITHLPSRVKINGNPRRYSAFAGENMIGVVGKTITQRSKKVLVRQIKERFDLQYKMHQFETKYVLNPKISAIVSDRHRQVKESGVISTLTPDHELFNMIRTAFPDKSFIPTQTRLFQNRMRFDAGNDNNMGNAAIYFKSSSGTTEIGVIKLIFTIDENPFFVVRQLRHATLFETLPPGFIDESLWSYSCFPLHNFFAIQNPCAVGTCVILPATRCMFKAILVPYDDKVFYCVPFNLAYEHN